MNYKQILMNILEHGIPKQPVRFENGVPMVVENPTIGTFCEIFRHNMAEGFPLTTLRKMPFKSMCVELEGFIKGVTSKKWYQDRGCRFWDQWASPIKVQQKIDDMNSGDFLQDEYHNCNPDVRKEIQLYEDDLGPIYGYQWRKFGEQSGEVGSEPFIEGGRCPATGEYQLIYTNINGIGYFGENSGFDQLKSIVDKLKTNPYDRRMVCSAWNPNHLDQVALPPCHYAFTVVVYGNKLNLCWKQRSVDAALGLPNNIASYGLLLLLLCEESGLEPGELVGVLEDCHLYENTIESTKELIKRESRMLPELKIKRKKDGSFDIFNWDHSEVELIHYNPHPKLNMGAVTV